VRREPLLSKRLPKGRERGQALPPQHEGKPERCALQDLPPTGPPERKDTSFQIGGGKTSRLDVGGEKEDKANFYPPAKGKGPGPGEEELHERKEVRTRGGARTLMFSPHTRRWDTLYQKKRRKEIASRGNYQREGRGKDLPAPEKRP